MRFLADENFPLVSVRRLRADGHDAKAIIEDSPGATDREVLALAELERRILLTFDRDYGDLIFRRRLPPPTGVVYFRFDPQTPEEPQEQLAGLLTIHGLQLDDNFTVVERRRSRQRPLP